MKLHELKEMMDTDARKRVAAQGRSSKVGLDRAPLSDPDFEYDRRLELRDEFHGADLTREDIHLGAGLLEDE
jgi:hypothetical protein